ncbi:hypothetical protein MBLNU459_g1245t1 [Dothideomycetes sp. NU459]
MLQFGHNQIFWECPSLSACEAYPNGLPRFLDAEPREDLHWKQTLQRGAAAGPLQPINRPGYSLDNFWEIAVRTYTSCNLTVGSDKIVAIAGIANLILEGLEESYVAGLWRNNLEEQLSWRVIDCKQANGKPSVRAKEYRAPSWSWASLDGVVQLRKNIFQFRDYKIDIIHVDVQTARNFETGPVLKGSILLKGHVGKMKFIRDVEDETEWGVEIEALRGALFEVSMDVNPSTDTLECFTLVVAYTEEPAGRTMPGFSGHGLLLQRESNVKGRFMRCGSFTFTGLSLQEWRAVEAHYEKSSQVSEEYSPKFGHTIILV